MPRDVIAWASDRHRSNGRVAENFDKSCRLLAAGDYGKVFAARRVLNGTLFAVHYCQGKEDSARLGLAIPKKQARTAVLRNAIKRQAREVFRHRRTELPPVDLVLRLARPVKAQTADRAAWRFEIGRLFDRLCRERSSPAVTAGGGVSDE